MRILLVEDDRKIASFILKGLKAEGFAVDHAADGDDRRGNPALSPLRLRGDGGARDRGPCLSPRLQARHHDRGAFRRLPGRRLRATGGFLLHRHQ